MYWSSFSPRIYVWTTKIGGLAFIIIIYLGKFNPFCKVSLRINFLIYFLISFYLLTYAFEQRNEPLRLSLDPEVPITLYMQQIGALVMWRLANRIEEFRYTILFLKFPFFSFSVLSRSHQQSRSLLCKVQRAWDRAWKSLGILKRRDQTRKWPA